MSVSIKGYKINAVTLAAARGLKKGDFVKISANNTVAACASGNEPCGLCLGTDGYYACVQLEGYMKVKYTGTAPALGSAVITADGNGGIKTAASGKTVLVVSVDTATATAEIIF